MTAERLVNLVTKSNTLMGGNDFWLELAQQTGVSMEQMIDINLELQGHVNSPDFWHKFAIKLTEAKS